MSVAQPTFREVLADAIAELARTGYVSPDRVDYWAMALRNAAERDIGSEQVIDQNTARRLGAIYERLADRGKVADYVPGVSRYTIAQIKPQLRAELDRRIIASADLIKLNRREAIETTLSRFRGWSTSIPPGGDGAIDKRATKTDIAKSVAHQSYRRRLVLNDQGHKLIANIADIVATDAGAIAGTWHDHGEHDKNYDARKQHMAWAKKTFLIRGSWADKMGLVQPVHGYTDEIDRPGQPVNCRCWLEYVTSPRALSDQFLTAKGQEFVAGRLAA